MWSLLTDNGLLAGLLAMCAVTGTLMLLRNRQFRTVTGRDLAREQIARLREQREIRGTLDELLQEIGRVHERAVAELDQKLRQVNEALAAADESLARLSLDRSADAVATRTAGERGAAGSASSDPPAAATTAPPRTTRERDIPAPPAALSPPVAEPRPRVAQPRAGLAPEVEARHRAVIERFDRGVSPFGIAEELGISLGEVELILNLRHFQSI